MATDQIPILEEHYLNIIEQIGNFQEGTPSSSRTDYSEIGLGGCSELHPALLYGGAIPKR